MVLELKNIQENKNPFFKRNEVKADVELDITPSREDALKALCEKFSCSIDVISVIRIDSNFGTKVFTVVADIYESKEAKDAIAMKRKKEIEAEKKVEEEKKKAEDEKKAAEAEKAEEKVPEQDSETKAAKPAAPEGVPSNEGKESAPDNTQKDKEEVKAPEVSPEQGGEKKE